MSLLRTLPLLACVALLAACAGKPVRDAAPASTLVTPPEAAASAATPVVSDSDATTSVESVATPTATAPATATAGSSDVAPTDAEDDFSALYGGPAPSTSADTGAVAAAASSYDPWEKYNRTVHRFNNAVDRTVARPLATAYVNVVPQFARTGVTNFFSNLRAPLTMVNQALQGHPDDAWDTLGRFLMNSTFGIGGLFDPASKAMVPRRSEDFGQTLGAWGWRQSRYVELPFFGPRTVRDVVGMAGDIPLSPVRTIESDKVRIGLQGLQLVDMRMQLLAVDALRDSAVDEYSLTRDAWLQRRNYQIEKDLRRDRRGNDDEQPTIPVDAMPMPDWGG